MSNTLIINAPDDAVDERISSSLLMIKLSLYGKYRTIFSDKKKNKKYSKIKLIYKGKVYLTQINGETE